MFIQNAIYNRTSLPVVSKSLDAVALRSKAIADNLANVDTPGYKRLEVKFEEVLREALDTSKLQGNKGENTLNVGRPDLKDIQPMVYRSQDPVLYSGVNNVDVDMEASKMAENQILFDYDAKFVKERRGAIESAIRMAPSK
jgi:flagellar basal-body rod protein FlgB